MPKSPDKSGRRKSSLGKYPYGPKVPVVLAKIFGPPPLLGDEDPQLYAELFSLFEAEYDPRDTQDWFLVKDKTDLRWERLRERRLKPEIIKIYQEQPAEEFNQPVFIITPADARL